jgi:type VI secretion system secreted protein VgrG
LAVAKPTTQLPLPELFISDESGNHMSEGDEVSSVEQPGGGQPGGEECIIGGVMGGIASGPMAEVTGEGLGGIAESAIGGLSSGSPDRMATDALGSATSLGTGAIGSSLTSLGVPPEMVDAGLGLASQGLEAAINLVAGLSGGQPIPKVEYIFEVSDSPDVLWQVRRMRLTEALSEPYTLILELVTEDIEADTEAMLGASVELLIARDVLVRRVCGIIHQVEYVGVAHDRLQIRVKIGPALALLGHRIDTRLWQNITVPDVLAEVLEAAVGDYSRTLKRDGLTASYQPREYIVQYRESDLDFVHRLMEEEGITYWFDHVSEAGKEVMVLEDSNDNFVDVETISDEPGLHIIIDRADDAEIESIQHFGWVRELTSTSITQRIFDWLDPTTPIVSTGPAEGGDNSDDRGRVREVYHHGHFVEPDPQPRTTRKLMHLRQRDSNAHGVGNVTGLFPGTKFSMAEHPRADLEQEYLIRRVVHMGDCPDVMMGEVEADGRRYENHFECMVFDPADPYRPPNVTRRPRIHGPQTAIVTGPDDEEIHTDEHGRVKVLFNWDRVNEPGGDTSMWIRVAHHWAGPGFGTFFLPRIGMEVVVEFIEGDPAKPLINGCIYNGANQCSVTPAENKTQSTIRTRSSKDSEGYNEILFEDAADSEKIVLHAQKDFNETVENNHSTSVGGDQSNSVEGEQSNTVKKDQSNTVTGKQTETVTGDANWTYESKQTITITDDQTVTVNGASKKLDVPNGAIDVTAKNHIKFTCGDATLEMTPAYIELKIGDSRIKLDHSLIELFAAGGGCIWLNDTAKMKSVDGSHVYLASGAQVLASEGAEVHLLSDAKMLSSRGASSVQLSSQSAKLQGKSEATISAPTTVTLETKSSKVEASPTGVAASGGKVDLIASGMATIVGSVVKIN